MNKKNYLNSTIGILICFVYLLLLPIICKAQVTIPYFSDFESNNGNLYGTGSWNWGLPFSGPAAAHSGFLLWGTNLNGTYPADADDSLRLPIIDLSTTSSARLTYWQWYEFEDDEKFWDGGNVKISRDGGFSYEIIEPFRGYDGVITGSYISLNDQSVFSGLSPGSYWQKEVFNLHDFVGDTIAIVFHMASDGLIEYAGWYIDDISVDVNPFQRDVAVWSIESPQILIAAPILPKVKVYNAGKLTQTFDTEIIIHLNGIEEFRSNQIVSNLDPDELREICFQPWTPSDTGLCKLYASTLLSGDEDSSNDTLSQIGYIKSIYIYPWVPDTLWTKTIGDTGHDFAFSVQQTSDGGFIIAGKAFSPQLNYSSLCLIKTDAAGNTSWKKHFPDNIGDIGNNIVRETFDGGYIVSTSIYRENNPDIHLIKTDLSGNPVWARSYGGNLVDEGWAMQQTADSGFVIAGYTDSYGAGEFDIWLIKTDKSGFTEWTKSFGSNRPDRGYGVDQTTDGGYIITGSTTPSFAQVDLWLIKTDGSGNIVWSKIYGGSSADRGRCVQQTYEGGYIIAGETRSYGAGSYDVWLLKTDSLGDTMWTRTFGESEYEQCSALQQTSDRGFVVTTSTDLFGAGGRDALLIKYDNTGELIWIKTMGGVEGDNLYFVQQTSDYGYILTGYTRSYGAGNGDIWLVRLTSEAGTDIKKNIGILQSDKFVVYQNYPNPFNPSTTIEFSLGSTEYVTLKVFNILGQEVTKLVSKRLTAGNHEYIWDTTHQNGISSGIYFYRLEAGSLVESKKMVLLK